MSGRILRFAELHSKTASMLPQWSVVVDVFSDFSVVIFVGHVSGDFTLNVNKSLDLN